MAPNKQPRFWKIGICSNRVITSRRQWWIIREARVVLNSSLDNKHRSLVWRGAVVVRRAHRVYPSFINRMGMGIRNLIVNCKVNNHKCKIVTVMHLQFRMLSMVLWCRLGISISRSNEPFKCSSALIMNKNLVTRQNWSTRR